MEITLKAYAERLGKNPVVVRNKAIKGGFLTAHKVGRDWFIDEDEPYVDKRRLNRADQAQQRLDKWEQAMQHSGLHPDHAAQILAQLPPEWSDPYTASQLGEIAKLLKIAYDTGASSVRARTEE